MLWLLMALAAVAASTAAVARGGLRATAARLDAARAEAAAEGGVHLAARWLMDRGETGWRPDAAPLALRVGEAAVTVSVESEAGKLDLNAAAPDALTALFAAAGREPEAAARLADVVLDLRDADDLVRQNGAEAPDYRAAGRAWGPRNAPFEAVDEAAQALGMDDALMAAIRPQVTLWSGVATLPAASGEPPPAWSGTAPPVAPGGGVGAPGAGGAVAPAFRVRATAEAGTARREVEAVIRLTGDAARPFLALSWRVGAPARPAEEASDGG